jgi:hypothetical protein
MKCLRSRLLIGMAALLAALPDAASARRKAKETSDFVWEQVTDADWSIGQETSWPDAHAIMIFEKISVDERELLEEKVSTSLYRRLRILDEIGRAQADVVAPMDFGEQKVTEVIARTVLPNGDEVVMSPENIHRETVLKAEGEKVKQTKFSIPGVSSDCIIEYRICYKSDQPSSGWLIQKDIPLVNGEYQWYFFDLARTGLKWWDLTSFMSWTFGDPQYVWRNITPSAPKRFPNTGHITEMVFTVSDIPPFETEQQSLPQKNLVAKLICFYGSGSPPAVYWSYLTESMEEWMRDDFCSKIERVKKAVGENATEGDLEQRMRAAYDWVQSNIINTSFVDFAEAMEEKGVKARKKEKDNETADDVVKRGYGRSVDLTQLYCAFLREMGLDAKLALVVDRSSDIFIREVPSWQFDRTLVAVFDSTKNVHFFAPGVPYVPYGMVPWFNEGVQALLEGNQGEMKTVPPSPPEATVENHLYSYTLVPGEEVRGTAQSRLTGHAAGHIRGQMLRCDSAEHKDLLKEASADFLTAGEYDSLKCDGLAEVEAPLKLSGNVKFPAVSDQAGRLLFKPLDYFVKRDNPFVSATRKTPIVFRSAYQRKESAQFELPEGWSIEALPTDTMFTNRVGKCGVQFMQLGDKLSVQRSFTLNAPMWKVEDYHDIRALFQARQEMSDRIVVLIKS